MSAELAGDRRTVAYLMSRFPAVTETFILYEILELERRGLRVEVFPLLRHQEPVVHPGAERLVARAHYEGHFSWALVMAQLYWLFKKPAAYLRAWWEALAGNVRSPGFFLRALLVVPKAALFARQMEALGVEHVHAHWATHPTLAAYVIKRLTGLSYSFTCHAHDLYVDRTMLAEKVKAASKIVTISEFNRRLLTDWFGGEARDKTVVVRCGIDAEVFKPRESRPDNPVLTLLCIASFREYKGHRYLLDSLSLLKKAGVPFRCLLVGDGEDRPLVEAQRAALGLEKEVELLGKQPRNRVSELTAQADVLVMPSVVAKDGQMEGIPVALMEALASETPVIATAISGVPELVVHEQTGLLVPEKDARAMADAIQRLAENPELRERLATAGRVKVLEEFNLVRNAQQLYELLVSEGDGIFESNEGMLRVRVDETRRVPETSRDVGTDLPFLIPAERNPGTQAPPGPPSRTDVRVQDEV